MNVQGNEFAFNNWANFLNGGGSKFEYATNLIVRNNYSHDNYGPGFHTDADSLNVLYEYNHTKNNVNAGLQHEISWDAIIRYNLFEDETAAIGRLGEAIGRVELYADIPALMAKALVDGLSLEGGGEALSIGAAGLFLRSLTGTRHLAPEQAAAQ